MCREMEELCNEVKVEEKITTARAMAEDGISTERIARIREHTHYLHAKTC